MGQMAWTLVDDYGAKHRIGLVHGDENHHLMVYCDDRILLIDFDVKNSRNYSFFLNEMLVDISLEEKKGKFAYGLEVDEKSDTPRNRLKKQQDKRHLYLTLMAFTVFAAFVAGILIWLFNING